MARKFRTKYASPRALLIEKGLAKQGSIKGRFSTEGRALVAEARSKGVVFENDTIVAAPRVTAPVVPTVEG
jgi:hypothetical protein